MLSAFLSRTRKSSNFRLSSTATDGMLRVTRPGPVLKIFITGFCNIQWSSPNSAVSASVRLTGLMDVSRFQMVTPFSTFVWGSKNWACRIVLSERNQMLLRLNTACGDFFLIPICSILLMRSELIGTTSSALIRRRILATRPSHNIGNEIRRRLTPQLRMAMISLLRDSRPRVSRVAMRIENGAACPTISGNLKKK